MEWRLETGRTHQVLNALQIVLYPKDDTSVSNVFAYHFSHNLLSPSCYIASSNLCEPQLLKAWLFCFTFNPWVTIFVVDSCTCQIHGNSSIRWWSVRRDKEHGQVIASAQNCTRLPRKSFEIGFWITEALPPCRCSWVKNKAHLCVCFPFVHVSSILYRSFVTNSFVGSLIHTQGKRYNFHVRHRQILPRFWASYGKLVQRSYHQTSYFRYCSQLLGKWLTTQVGVQWLWIFSESIVNVGLFPPFGKKI